MSNRHLALAIAVVLASVAVVRADTYPRNPAIDILGYSFRLTLTDEADEIVGEATVAVRFLQAGADRFALDLVNAAGRTDGRGMRVSAVTSGTTAVPFTHDGDRIELTLPSPPAAGERREVTIRYRGVPAAGLVVKPNKHGERTFFSDNWPDKARHWLPTVDHIGEKATLEMIVTAPAHYQVVSNGLLLEETDLDGGRRLSRWRQTVPTSPWLFTLGVARFAMQQYDTFEGKPLQTWVYRQDRDAGFHDFAVPSKHVLEFYSDAIGPYSYEKLANIQSNAVGGGMEAASAISYGANSVTGTRTTRWRNVVIHEIAHQWWGNSVTEFDWDHVWLSEGFATYFTSLFIEHAYGRDEFLDVMRRSRDTVRSFHQKRPDYRIVHQNLADMSQVTTSQTYQKGGWTLHMLRSLVGTEAFWTGIRRYYRQYRDQTASTDDFRRIMEDVSGQPLGWFFRQWLYEPGYLKVDGTWHYDRDVKALTVSLKQVQEDVQTFRMPIEIGIAVEGQPLRLERVELDQRAGEFRIALDAEPADVRLDPNLWVLMDATFARR